jgi:RNA polymerase sigma factor (sigma-70 family)
LKTVQSKEGRSPFPATITSAVLGLKSEDTEVRRASWDRVARAYRDPIARYLGLRWRLAPNEAADTAQAFFTRSLEKGTFASFDARKARFRTFLRTCLDRFYLDERRLAKAAKRGGLSTNVDIDDMPGGEVAQASGADAEACFEAEWKKHILERALERLREQLVASKKVEHLRAFERFHLESDEPPSYTEIAKELGITVTDVTNRLSYARRKLRAATLEILREITATEEEFRHEAKTVLGVDV